MEKRFADKAVICAVLIVVLTLAEAFAFGGFSWKNLSVPFNAGVGESTNESIESTGAYEAHPVLVRESTLTSQVNGLIRISKKKNSESEKTALRILIIAILATLLHLLISLSILKYRSFYDCVNQRMSIILYIHNKDGLKRRCLS